MGMRLEYVKSELTVRLVFIKEGVMKHNIFPGAVAAFLAVVLTSSMLAAQPGKLFKLRVLEGSTMIVEGDSTMRRYSTATREIKLNSEISSKVAVDVDSVPVKELMARKSYSPALVKIMLDLAVKDFKAGIVGFDGHFRKAMKESDFPRISFTMLSGTISSDPDNDGRLYVKVKGNTKIAGVEKPVTLNTVVTANGNHVTVTGSKDLFMTDFNITPPTLLFVSADNKITVKWKLNIAIERR